LTYEVTFEELQHLAEIDRSFRCEQQFHAQDTVFGGEKDVPLVACEVMLGQPLVVGGAPS
jgi:hypothetical protein